jgi:hypothetical protein
MIDPNWSVVDLDPHTWRNLGRFFDPGQYLRAAEPGEHALYVLHDNGRTLNVFDTQIGARPELVSGPIADPQLLAHDLYESGEWDRVQVINKQHLAAMARNAQTVENRALNLDEYYRRVFELVWREPGGYVSLPPHPGHWNHWTYGGIAALIAHLPDPTSVALAVIEEGRLEIGLVLELQGGLIRKVTTFEALSLSEPLTVSSEGLSQLCAAVEARFAPTGAALVCQQAVFEGWITASDKLDYLQEAARQKTAFWRLRLKPH